MKISRQPSNSSINRPDKGPSMRDFQVIKKLGEGSFGVVYQVKRHADNQIYALKKVRMHNMPQKERLNALNEIRILASVESPFIIGYKEAFIDEPSLTLCLVLEFAESGDLLAALSKKGRDKTLFSESEVWRCIAQLALGLKALHSNKILHRDLKCANIFISQDKVYKLGDLNVSKVADHLVRTQTGTPYYASPEVWSDKPYGQKSDVWSLGCVLYEMITLKPPFRAQDMKGLYKKVIQGRYDPIGSKYSNALGQCISKMLIVDPNKRASVDQILQDPSVQAVIDSEQFLGENKNTVKMDLLKTIQAPRNLKGIHLPQSKYSSHNGNRAASADLKSQPTPTNRAIPPPNYHSNANKKIPSHQNIPRLPVNKPKLPVNPLPRQNHLHMGPKRPSSVRGQSAQERSRQYSNYVRSRMMNSPSHSRNSSNNNSRLQLAADQIVKQDHKKPSWYG